MAKEILNFVLKRRMKRKIKDKKTGGPDFQRYFGSEMSGSERNSFERDLQKDPFASEAEEGWEMVSPEEAKNDLSDLGNRLKGRTGKRKGISYYYSIAASVAVLMILSTVWLFVSRNKPESPAEKNLQEITQLEVPQPEKIAEPAALESDYKEEPEITVAQATVEENRPIKEALPTAPVQQATLQSEKDKISLDVENGVKDAEAEATSRAIIATGAAGVSAPLAVGGVKKEALSEESVTLAVAAEDIVSIADDSSVNKAAKAAVSSPSEPINGFDEFDKYAKENIIIPDEQKEGTEKTVVLEFIVKETGEFGEFRVIRSPAQEYSLEAERLIKDGPEWKPAILGGKDVESKVRLRIVFKKDQNN